jgi:hypothetical protein
MSGQPHQRPRRTLRSTDHNTLVEWFNKVGLDPVTGMWVVHPDIVCRQSQSSTVLHLATFVRAAHLIPVFGPQKMPRMILTSPYP